MKRKAFTLIELLVVIAIIAILAAILFPVFARAKLAAKKTADLNNGKQIGLGIQMYMADYTDMYPVSNHRMNNGIQEMHWSWMVLPYIKSEQLFVSPADKIGGWAPGCFDAATKNRGFGNPGIQENGCAQQGYPANVFTLQVGRISYIANQAVIGRKRTDSDTSNAVSAYSIENPSSTITVAPATEAKNCMRTEIGGEYRSYRPAFGIAAAGQQPLSGSSIPSTAQQPLEAMSAATLNTLFSCETATDPGMIPNFTLRYTHRGRFDQGNNYVYADSSSKWRPTRATFNVDNYQWGVQAWSLGGLIVVNPANGQPVRN